MSKAKTDPTATAPINRLTLASTVASRVQITNVYQQSASFRRLELLSNRPDALEIQTSVITKFDQDSGKLVAYVSCRVHANTANNDEYMNIEAVYVASYTVAGIDGLTREHIDAFGDINGTYNVWPYWREFVQSSTMRMGLAPLTLPVHRPADQRALPRAGAKSKATDRARAPET